MQNSFFSGISLIFISSLNGEFSIEFYQECPHTEKNGITQSWAEIPFKNNLIFSKIEFMHLKLKEINFFFNFFNLLNDLTFSVIKLTLLKLIYKL